MIFARDSEAIRWANETVGLSWSGRARRVVEAAHAVGLFERLGKAPAAVGDLARDLALDAEMVEKVLIVLAAMGLAGRRGRHWLLSPKAEATLVPEAPLYQGNTLAHSAQVWSRWNNLEFALRGQPGGWVFSEAAEQGFRSYRDFILAMHNMAMAGRAAELADRVDLGARQTLVDVGGGPGTYAMALCERNGGLRATVMDLPEAVEIARGLIERFGLADRVRAVVGDWNEAEFGVDVDAVLLSNVLHGPTSDAEMKLAKAHRAMTPGGLLIIQDFLMNPEKTGPLIPALFNLMVGGFSVTELTDRVAAAGFAGIRVRPMPDGVGTTVVTATR
ncbi:MAG TPA: class I SAM-dependent methyltransferase [Phycisphaerae bacterium]|nr:class I SAM-dependent methyltransferase [Phycisphaerae bacterium]